MTARTAVAGPGKHPVDEVLPFPQMCLYVLHHVLSMYAGVVAVPLIVGNALELSGPEITYLVSAGLFISGLATLLQFGHLSMDDAVKLYQQYTVKIPFVPAPASAAVGRPPGA